MQNKNSSAASPSTQTKKCLMFLLDILNEIKDKRAQEKERFNAHGTKTQASGKRTQKQHSDETALAGINWHRRKRKGEGSFDREMELLLEKHGDHNELLNEWKCTETVETTLAKHKTKKQQLEDGDSTVAVSNSIKKHKKKNVHGEEYFERDQQFANNGSYASKYFRDTAETATVEENPVIDEETKNGRSSDIKKNVYRSVQSTERSESGSLESFKLQYDEEEGDTYDIRNESVGVYTDRKSKLHKAYEEREKNESLCLKNNVRKIDSDKFEKNCIGSLYSFKYHCDKESEKCSSVIENDNVGVYSDNKNKRHKTNDEMKPNLRKRKERKSGERVEKNDSSSEHSQERSKKKKKRVKCDQMKWSSPCAPKSTEKDINTTDQDMSVLELLDDGDVTRITDDDHAVSVDTIKKIRSLKICLNWDLPVLHTIETRVTSAPTREQWVQIKKLNVDIRKGTFNNEERNTISRNFNSFCSEYDLPKDPTPFLKSKQGNQVIWNNKNRICFVQYLSRGLDTRLLYTIFRQFLYMHTASTDRTGKKFTPKEDQFIQENVSKFKHPLVCIGKILHRQPNSILKRYSLLTKDSCVVKWNLENCEKLLRAIMEVTLTVKVEELKHREIIEEEWQIVSSKMKAQVARLKAIWFCKLYPFLFIPPSLDRKIVIEETLNRLINTNTSHWAEVNWKQLVQDFEGWTYQYLKKTIQKLVTLHVPHKIKQDVQKSAEHILKCCNYHAKPQKHFKYEKGILTEQKRMSDF